MTSNAAEEVHLHDRSDADRSDESRIDAESADRYDTTDTNDVTDTNDTTTSVPVTETSVPGTETSSDVESSSTGVESPATGIETGSVDDTTVVPTTSASSSTAFQPDTGDSWHDLQGRFVDDPESAVREAGALVEQDLATLRSRLETGDTENLRTAFRRYRDLHASLL